MEEELASQKRKFDFCLKDERNIAASEMAKRDEKIEALQKIIAALENKFDRKDTPKPEATRKKISQGMWKNLKLIKDFNFKDLKFN